MSFFRAKPAFGRRIIVVLLGCFGGFASQARGVNVWIDTDPSIGLPFREVDDAFALILAFHSPEIRIRGMSTTYGNASLEDTTRIAQDLVARFARKKCGVYTGARSPGDIRQSEASEALATALHKERLTYIALGPLTNLASFLRLHPELARRIDRVILVGGQTLNARFKIGTNGWLSIHDANVFKDAVATAEVLKSECPVNLAPIKTSMQLQVTAADLERMRHAAAGEFLYRRTRLWLWFWRRVVGMEGGPVFDALPILALIQPDLVSSEEAYVVVKKSNLIVEKTPAEGRRKVCIYSALTPSARQFLCQRLK